MVTIAKFKHQRTISYIVIKHKTVYIDKTKVTIACPFHFTNNKLEPIYDY